MSSLDPRIEDMQVELAKQDARIKALENIVYKRNTVAPSQSVQKILADLEVSLRDRLEIVNENEVRAREYFGRKDEWSTVNKLLKQHGFKWISQGKESHWSRQ